MKAIEKMTLKDMCDALKNGEASSVDLTEKCLERIHQVEDKVGAFVTVTEEEAMKQAEIADQLRASGAKVAPLCGAARKARRAYATNSIERTSVL